MRKKWCASTYKLSIFISLFICSGHVLYLFIFCILRPEQKIKEIKEDSLCTCVRAKRQSWFPDHNKSLSFFLFCELWSGQSWLCTHVRGPLYFLLRIGQSHKIKRKRIKELNDWPIHRKYAWPPESRSVTISCSHGPTYKFLLLSLSFVIVGPCVNKKLIVTVKRLSVKDLDVHLIFLFNARIILIK